MPRLNRLIAVATVCGVATIGLVGGERVAQGRSGCDISGSRSVIGNSFIVVYGHLGRAYVCQRSTGRQTLLKGAKPRCNAADSAAICDRFAIGGKWVAWTTGNPNDVDVAGGRVTVMYVPTRSINHALYPTAALDGVLYKLLVLSDGAVAWSSSEPDQCCGAFGVGVFGTDMKNHPIDRLDTCRVGENTTATCYPSAMSLHVASGKTIGWLSSPDGSSPATTPATSILY
jgi:hypothetical protein